MAKEIETYEPRKSEVLQELSKEENRDVNLLCFYLATNIYPTADLGFLEAVANRQECGFDLDSALSRLKVFGVLEEISALEEIRERIHKLSTAGSEQIGILNTNDLRKNRREINILEDKLKTEYKVLKNEIRYRLNADFKEYYLSARKSRN